MQNPLFRNRRCCSAGDFNYNLLSENSNTTFVDTFQSHHFFPLITKPTRFPENDNHSPSLIDHIWFNSLNIVNSGVVSYDLTDHAPTFLQIPMPFSKKSPGDDYIKLTFRLNNQQNRERFRGMIRDFDWTTISSENINEYTENFSRKLDSFYCSAFPLKTKCIPKKKALNPWFTPDLAKLIQEKSTYFHLFRIFAITMLCSI